jgi:hypothetical protein
LRVDAAAAPLEGSMRRRIQVQSSGGAARRQLSHQIAHLLVNIGRQWTVFPQFWPPRASAAYFGVSLTMFRGRTYDAHSPFEA